MAYLPTIARTLLGLIFVVFGLNGFLNFMQAPPPPEEGLNFIMALINSGYLFTLVKTVEVATGALLLLNLFVPLSLVLLAPVALNIILFHLFLAPGGLPISFLILALGLFTAWHHRDAYQPLFQARRGR